MQAIGHFVGGDARGNFRVAHHGEPAAVQSAYQVDRVALRPLTVAYQTETEAVISQGITSADRVVTTGFSRLRDGATISLPENEPPPPAPGASPAGRAAKMRAACADAMKRFCANVERSRSAIRACLEANAAQLSEACKSAAAEAVARGKRGRESSSTE